MTKTFERFLKQYNATGKEKGEGYDSSHFEGLTSQELSTAEDMLINDAMRLDTAAIQGLGVLKSDNAEKVLRLLLTTVKSPSKFHLSIAGALWEVTHDLALQAIILEDYISGDEDLKRTVAVVLGYTTPSLTTYKAFMEMLRTENQESILRIIATSGILCYYGLLKTPSDRVNIQKYMPLVRILSNAGDDKELAAAIAEVEKEAAKLKG